MTRVGFGIAICLSMASAAAAHPGHGATPDGWLHVLAESLHAAPFALGAVLALTWLRSRRAAARVPKR